MNQPLKGLPAAVSLAPGASRNDMIEAIAQKIEKLPMRGLGGIEAIESFGYIELAELGVKNTVFAVISEELTNLGIQQDGTLVGVMEGLGYPQEPEQDWSQAAHEIGCYCHGEYISPQMAADRLRHLKT